MLHLLLFLIYFNKKFPFIRFLWLNQHTPFTFIYHFGSKLLGIKSPSLWTNICAFLDQDNFPSGSEFVAIMSFFLMLGMFFLMTFTLNCVGTDLVTTKDLIIIKSYDQILKQNIKVIDNAIVPEFAEFKSKTDSKEHALFQNTELLEAGPEALLKISELGIDQKLVVISRLSFTKVIACFTLGQAFQASINPDLRADVAPDKEASKFTNVIVFNSQVKGSMAEIYLNKV